MISWFENIAKWIYDSLYNLLGGLICSSAYDKQACWFYWDLIAPVVLPILLWLIILAVLLAIAYAISR
ncbi:hypothetical protein [Candidatus Methanodesulfokora washburnensis]|jgi:hypothetical protein|uniref:Uncharacterized protein n=1 Tax=Candidatus Methanodesulfokora washburnensis TaxID=2478471 RepID=A0A3R9R3G3_9CREN|nr:hypothetical protein [Candidatus Methanodesulfokores washburnensis]RSN78439.1 hypothetical protein D6D85_00880 [Candidatus Methanodesulfokores washburnensis]